MYVGGNVIVGLVRGNMEIMVCVCRWECDSGPSTRKHGDYGVCM